MKELPYIIDPKVFSEEIRRLIDEREYGKIHINRSKRIRLSKEQRKRIFDKTDGRCHVCGGAIDINEFEADHVKNHTSGGLCNEENFLPSCGACNNYRWHYSPEELQWILKIGIWAKTQIAKETDIGKDLTDKFLKHESNREKRRKNPRTPHNGQPAI